MKTTVSKQHFIDAFMTSSNYRNNFSYDGLEILFDYLENLEGDCGIELELDVVAFCCDYSEMRVADIAADCGLDIDDSMTDEEIVDTVRDYLQDNTMICGEYENDDITYFVFCSAF